LYKGELSFYYSNAVPSDVNVIDTTAYFKLIGRSHYNQSVIGPLQTMKESAALCISLHAGTSLHKSTYLLTRE